VRWLVALLLTATLALFAAPGIAADDARLRALFNAGAQAYKQGKFLAAVHAFEEAYKIAPRPQLLFSAAQALRRQHAVDGDAQHLEQALGYYRKYLELGPEGGRRLDAAKAIEEIQPLLARESGGEGGGERPAASVTRLMITTQAPGAEVVLDGGDARKMPLIEEVKPGRHRVVVRAKGYRAVRRDVVALEGAVVAIEVDLPERAGRLSIGADSGQLWIDGEARGDLPLARALAIAPGRHVVTVLERGHEPFTREIDVERGEDVTVDVSLSRTWLRSASYVVIATGAAAVVASGVLAAVAIAKEVEAKDIDEARASGERRTEADRSLFNDAVAARNDMRLAAGVTAASGALVLGAGLALFLLDEPAAPAYRMPTERESGPSDDGELEVSLGASPTFWGGSLRGRF
jgi:tetratricopeptide (TPR) repeat protein